MCNRRAALAPRSRRGLCEVAPLDPHVRCERERRVERTGTTEPNRTGSLARASSPSPTDQEPDLDCSRVRPPPIRGMRVG